MPASAETPQPAPAAITPSKAVRLCGWVCLLAAAAIWLPIVHLFFIPATDATDEADALARYQTTMWVNPEAITNAREQMRRINPEWDFMGRTYLVLGLANLALREPAGPDVYLATMDAIIDDTLTQERAHGKFYFMMDYARAAAFRNPQERSIFIDGEIALMLAARRLVQEKQEYRAAFQERLAYIEGSMRAGPVLCAESYPDECWTFCNTLALAAMRCGDALDGTDHREFFHEWVMTAKQRLIEPQSGLLVSSFDVHGRAQDGPEGSSLWMAAHCLQLVDADFARDQYQRARAALGRNLLGFGYASEWPRQTTGQLDVDSGPVIPLVNASPSSSGLALVGAAAFGDAPFMRALRTSLNFAGFPGSDSQGRRYLAGNQVGDAVLLYALALGPLWAEVERRAPR